VNIDGHLYTLHRTYTGAGCAMCGAGPVNHPPDTWLVDGEKKANELSPSPRQTNHDGNK
jgi:hypothetical protein